MSFNCQVPTIHQPWLLSPSLKMPPLCTHSQVGPLCLLYLLSALLIFQKYCKDTYYSKYKQVNPKGNQPQIFIGGTDAEAEAWILWPPDAKSWLTGKDPDAGEGRRRRGRQRMRLLDGITDSMNMDLGGLRETVMNREAWVLQFMGSQRVGHDWATELSWLGSHILHEPL